MTTIVTLVPERSRYEITVDGELAGLLEIHDDGGVRTMPHTLVFPQFEGRGYAAQLAGRALADARADGVTVNPTCWYVAGYLDQHPEYADLRARPSDRER